MTRRWLPGVLLTGLLAAACSSPTAPASTFTSFALVTSSQTAAFEYRHAPDDSVDVAWQEAFHTWATGALGVTVTRRIRYNKYRDRAHMGDIIGQSNTNAFADAERFEIHTIWPRDNHEVIHLYSSAWGRPVALWSEGLAVAFQTDPVAGDLEPRWNRTALHDHARRFHDDGRLVPIAELLTTAGFRQFDPNVTYPEAGSFVRHVMATCGLEGVRRLFASGTPGDGAAAVMAQFEAACARPIAAEEAAWIASLNSR
jgi:hypothetical protein